MNVHLYTFHNAKKGNAVDLTKVLKRCSAQIATYMPVHTSRASLLHNPLSGICAESFSLDIQLDYDASALNIQRGSRDPTHSLQVGETPACTCGSTSRPHAIWYFAGVVCSRRPNVNFAPLVQYVVASSLFVMFKSWKYCARLWAFQVYNVGIHNVAESSARSLRQ